MPAITRIVKISLIAASLLIAGCGTFPKNPPLKTLQPEAGYRFEQLRPGARNSDDLFVVLSFSGGGTRAAALAYGAMEALRKTEIVWEGVRKRLLDEVDVISAVSGGSFTGAYYAVFGEGLFDGRFERVFLKTDVEEALVNRAASPSNWARLAGTSYGRSDLAAEYYHKHIFNRASYRDLTARGQRPLVILNATDMGTGEPFPFVQEQFDLICSDLSAVPVARAVAASSAFPGLLTPLTFRSYAGECDYREPAWMQKALAGRKQTPDAARWAESRQSYYRGQTRSYLHLFDGGVADNIGLRGLLFALSETSAGPIRERLGRGAIEKLLVVVVNATTRQTPQWADTPAIPGLIDVLKTAAFVPLDRYSYETVQRAWEVVTDYNRSLEGPACQKEDCDPGRFAPEFYLAQVGFDFVEEPAVRRELNQLPTRLALPPATVDELRTLAVELLYRDPEFRRFLESLQGSRQSELAAMQGD